MLYRSSLKILNIDLNRHVLYIIELNIIKNKMKYLATFTMFGRLLRFVDILKKYFLQILN